MRRRENRRWKVLLGSLFIGVAAWLFCVQAQAAVKPPDKPEMKSVKADSTLVTCKWKAVEKASYYRVYRSKDQENWTRIAVTEKTSWKDLEVSPGTWYYRVKGVRLYKKKDYGGQWSKPKEVTVTIPYRKAVSNAKWEGADYFKNTKTLAIDIEPGRWKRTSMGGFRSIAKYQGCYCKVWRQTEGEENWKYIGKRYYGKGRIKDTTAYKYLKKNETSLRYRVISYQKIDGKWYCSKNKYYDYNWDVD